MKVSKIKIKVRLSQSKAYYGTVFVNGKWYKEIPGCPSPKEAAKVSLFALDNDPYFNPDGKFKLTIEGVGFDNKKQETVDLKSG